MKQTPKIPGQWTGEIPEKRTLSELIAAVQTSDCITKFEVETWYYETFWQSVWNNLPKLLGNVRKQPLYSVGTLLRILFFCYSDSDPSSTREVPISRTMTLKNCELTITETLQSQALMVRSWVRWAITILFKDDQSSERVNSAINAMTADLGMLPGVTSVIGGIAGILSSLIPQLDKTDAVLVARHTAGGGSVWVNVGLPSSRLIAGPVRLSDELCEILEPFFPQPLTTPKAESGEDNNYEKSDKWPSHCK